MGKRGPKRTPTAILKVRGSTRAASRKDEPEATLGEPMKPDFLNKAASAEWDRVTVELREMGILTTADHAMLTVYCTAWAEFIEADAVVKEEGMTVTGAAGNPVIHPAVRIRNTAQDTIRRAADHFGLSPSARSSIKVQDKKPTDGKAGYFNSKAG